MRKETRKREDQIKSLEYGGKGIRIIHGNFNISLKKNAKIGSGPKSKVFIVTKTEKYAMKTTKLTVTQESFNNISMKSKLSIILGIQIFLKYMIYLLV